MENERFSPFITGRKLYADKIANSSETYEALSAKQFKDYGLRVPSGFVVQRLKFNQNTVGEFGIDYNTLEGKKEIVEKDLKYLQTHLKDYLPKHHIVYSGKSEKDPKSIDAYLVKQKIESQEIMPREFAEHLDDFIDACGRMFVDSYNQKTRRGVIADMQLRDFVFGVAAGHKEAKLYFVDLFPTYRVTKQQFIDRINELTRNYMGIYGFPKTRNLIFETLNNLE